MFARKETMDLIRAYYQLSERRRRLLDLAKSLHSGTDQSDVAKDAFLLRPRHNQG